MSVALKQSLERNPNLVSVLESRFDSGNPFERLGISLTTFQIKHYFNWGCSVTFDTYFTRRKSYSWYLFRSKTYRLIL